MQQAELPLSPNGVPWPDDFRTALGLDEGALAEAWTHRADYRPHRVPKRKARRIGPKREPRVAKKKRRPIDEPHPALRIAQEAIRRKFLKRIPLSSAAHGFRKGRSAKTALIPHRKSAAFFTVDFRNAFHKVTTTMLADALRECAPIIKSSWVPTLIALTTHRGRLPQGAPTSNDLFNIACRRLDANLSAFTETRGLVYTRYADAVIISAKTPLSTDLQREIETKIHAYGFPLAVEKTSYTEPRYAHPVIMGIAVVDGRLRVPRRQLDRARAFLHRARHDPTIPMTVVEGVLGNVRGLLGPAASTAQTLPRTPREPEPVGAAAPETARASAGSFSSSTVSARSSTIGRLVFSEGERQYRNSTCFSDRQQMLSIASLDLTLTALTLPARAA